MSYSWRFDLVFQHLNALLAGVGVTVLVSVQAFVIATAIGMLVALGRISRYRPANVLGRLYVDVARSTPLLAQLVWLYYALPILTGVSFSLMQTGVLGLSLYGGAYLAEVFRGGILSIGTGQHEAGHALGLTPAQVWRRIVLPQAIARMLPPAGSVFISLLKDSALLSVIGVPELMFEMLGINTTVFRSLETFTTGAGLYFLLTYPLALLVNDLYRRRFAHE
jgi:polar amino acid transport system permease protein